MRAADPAALVGLPEDQARVGGGVEAQREEVVEPQQLVDVVRDAARIARAVGELHPVRREGARPGNRVLRIHQVLEIRLGRVGDRRERGRDAMRALLAPRLEMPVAEEMLRRAGPDGGIAVRWPWIHAASIPLPSGRTGPRGHARALRPPRRGRGFPSTAGPQGPRRRGKSHRFQNEENITGSTPKITDEIPVARRDNRKSLLSGPGDHSTPGMFPGSVRRERPMPGGVTAPTARSSRRWRIGRGSGTSPPPRARRAGPA